MRPNIIFILADDLSYRDLSCYGQQVIQTPNLDRLARQGVRFTQAYAVAPECAPSRGCLMTGMHTGHGPIRQNASARGQDHLRLDDITIAEVLKKAGYATGFVGKWGIGQPQTEGVPYKQGFDYTFGFYDQARAHTYFPHYLWENDRKIDYPGNIGFDMQQRYNMNRLDPPPDLLNVYNSNGDLQIPELQDQSKWVYSQDEIEKAAVRFIKERSDTPFFLYFAPQLPHGPVIIDNLGAFAQMEDIPQRQREWGAMVKRLDTFSGLLVQLLKDLDIYERTIIFFASDNGYSMCGYMGRGNAPNWLDDPWLKNKGPFRGGKFSALEGGCRVPFFVSWPNQIKPDVLSAPVWLADFFPTAAELAGANFTEKLDGQSLIPLLIENEDQFNNERYFYFSKNNEQAVRMGPWKAYRPAPGEAVELYLIEEDVSTARNLADVYPGIVDSVINIMEIEHVDHEWYWNPGESREDFRAKQERAEAAGLNLPSIRPNGL